jgi:lipoate---protein ligase
VGGTFRVVDTGVREGRYNIALDQAMLEEHQAGRIPDTFRFMRFPPTALIGRHQALGQELDVDYCRSRGVGVVRRITGGGAIYLDEGQLGWGLVFHRKALGNGSLAETARDICGAVAAGLESPLAETARDICVAVAAGLESLGVEARYRPRNDIEVDGRKLSGTGGFFDGDTLIYQGTVLVDLDPSAMVAALRVPRAKLEKRQLDSAAQRVVTLRELLGPATPGLPAIQEALLRAFGERFGMDWRQEPLTDAEDAAAWRHYREEIGTEEFVAEVDDPARDADFLAGTHACPGGTVTTYVRLEGPARKRIGQALVTGDFFVAPPRTVLDLEAALRGAYVEDAAGIIDRFFAGHAISALSVTPADFRASIEAALAGGPRA